MSQRDVDLARAISGSGRGPGLRARPVEGAGLPGDRGRADTAEVMPFWQALLGYERRADTPDEDLVDPLDRGRPSGSSG
jgi:4a-hydroxytetrahydrobiopterin dehydratase